MLRPPAGFGVLTTTGRRTGKSRRRCIRAIRRDRKVYLVAIKGARTAWAKNVRSNPDVRLRIRGGTFTGVARVLREEAESAESAESREAIKAYCETVNPFDYLECAMWRTGRPTRSKIRELHRTWFEAGIPLVVELADRPLDQ